MRSGDAVLAGAAAEGCQLGGVGLADVGVPVGEQEEGGAGVAGDAARLLDAAQETAGEVGHPTALDRRDRALDRELVGERPGGNDDQCLVVERDEAELITGVEPVDQLDQRFL